MDDWKNKVKTEAANGGLSCEESADCTLFFHRDAPLECWVIVPHDVPDEWVRKFYFRQLMLLVDAVRRIGPQPDVNTVVDMQQERAQRAPLRAETIPKPVRCSGRKNDD